MLVVSDKVNNSLLQYHSESFKSNTVLPIKYGASRGVGAGGGSKGSFARVIKGNKLCENVNKTATLKLYQSLSVPSLPPRNKFTYDPKLHLTLQRLETTHETLAQTLESIH